MQNHVPTESFNGQIRLFGEFKSNALRGDTHSRANTPNYTNTHDLMGPIKIQLSPNEGIQWSHVWSSIVCNREQKSTLMIMQYNYVKQFFNYPCFTLLLI